MRSQSIDYHELVKTDAVHGRVYTDPDIFEEEMHRIYGREWVYVGHESEVPAVGDFKRKTLGRQSVIFCRDRQGRVNVLFNRCRHRASTVCQLERGNARNFRCEYHGWLYDLNGDLKAVPYPDGYERLATDKLGLTKPPRVDSYRGFVFASMLDQGRSLQSQLGAPTLEQIDYFCDLSPEGEVMVQAGASLMAYDGNWKLQMENTIDGYHPNFTHVSFFQGLERAGFPRTDTFDGNSIAECRALGNGNTMLDYRRYNRQQEKREQKLAMLQAAPWGRKYFDDLVAAHGRERAEDLIVVGGTHMNVFPNLFVLGQQVRTLRPVSVNRSEVELAPALLKGVPDELNAVRLRQYEMFYSPHGGGSHDDMEMFNRVTEGLRCTLDPWLLFSRGMHREVRDNEGTIVGHMTDETPQREMWRHWLEVMTTDD